LGGQYLSADGTSATAKHVFMGSIKDGCERALLEEVKRLRGLLDRSRRESLMSDGFQIHEGKSVKIVRAVIAECERCGERSSVLDPQEVNLWIEKHMHEPAKMDKKPKMIQDEPPEKKCGCGHPESKCAPENCSHPFARAALWGD
jgi:hypothetical protein